MISNGRLRSGLTRLCGGALAFVLLAAAAPPQDVEAVIYAASKPVALQKAVGCDLTFNIVRGPAQDDWTSVLAANISLIDFGPTWGVIMKVGVQTGPTATAAAAATWLDGADRNTGEVVKDVPSSDPQFKRIAFLLGPHTRKTLADFNRTGVLRMDVLTAEGIEQTWTLELSGRPEVLAEWKKCLATYPKLPADLAP